MIGSEVETYSRPVWLRLRPIVSNHPNKRLNQKRKKGVVLGFFPLTLLTDVADTNKIARFMDQQLPDRIRLQPLTGKKAFIEGILDPRRLQRIPGFKEVAAIRDIRLELRVETRESGLFLLNGRITARMELVCQRCLQEYSWSVDEPVRLNAGAVPGQVEGSESIDLDDDMLNIEQLVEDELILRIPQPPVHPRTEDCDPTMLQRTKEYAGEISEKRENPFAVLKREKP
jgi:uncharacterized protein